MKKRDTRWFENWAARVCMKPVCKVDDPDGEILLADSIEPIRSLGVYRTGFAIHRDGMEIGNYHDYPMGQYVMYSKSAGVQERVNEALAHARATQDELRRSGFYDGDKKRSFSHHLD